MKKTKNIDIDAIHKHYTLHIHIHTYIQHTTCIISLHHTSNWILNKYQSSAVVASQELELELELVLVPVPVTTYIPHTRKEGFPVKSRMAEYR